MSNGLRGNREILISMAYQRVIDFLHNPGKDPSRLLVEDALTGIGNRRFFLRYLWSQFPWNGTADVSISLLFMDLDGFRRIHETHGEAIGDQVLKWFSKILKSAAGETGLPMRYGGDEFLLLLPGADREVGRETAQRLLDKTRRRSFRRKGSREELDVTLSIGVATAPVDAQNAQELFQRAGLALEYVKRSGGNCAAAADEVDPSKVFVKAALHRLDALGLVGRRKELAVVSDCLGELAEGRSGFLLIDGTAGSGKTAFLEAVERSLTHRARYTVVQARGDPREAFRPYGLATRVIGSVLEQRKDPGIEALRRLSAEERAHLHHIVPDLPGRRGQQPTEDERERRKAIFQALGRWLTLVLESHPLILLIDDLHAADEATLSLLRLLVRESNPPLFVCGTMPDLSGDELSAFRDELRMRSIELTPLSPADIEEFLHGVFPGMTVSGRMTQELSRITRGNPLFLAEMVRKLVRDQKVTLVGREWVLQDLEKDDLPRSLEQLVLANIAELGEDDRELLARASIWGETVPLSILAGSAGVSDIRAAELADRAAALGLVTSKVELGDEVMRFRGKKILEVSYGVIDPRRRETLHGCAGAYQEKLSRQHLLSSASLLAYHFGRSAQPEKARHYEEMERAYGETVFQRKEAATYTSILPRETMGRDDSAAERDATDALEQRVSEESWEVLRDSLPALGRELLANGRLDLLRRAVIRVLEGIDKRKVDDREAALRSFQQFVGKLSIAHEHRFGEATIETLLRALFRESDPRILRQWMAIFRSLSRAALLMGDYKTACRVLSGLQERRFRLKAAEPALAGALDAILDLQMDPPSLGLLEEGLCSEDGPRRAGTVEVLGWLGVQAIPLLIDVIQRENQLGTRQLAARLLAELGPQAGRELKRALALEVTVEQRFRILEVIDLVTRDLKTEVAYSLGDASPKIRRAGFRLAERLGSNDLIEVILPFARHEDPAVAKGTIRSLAQIGSVTATRAIASLLDATESSEMAVACCQALGQIGDPGSIEALVKTLRRRKAFWIRHRWGSQVRATAALALAQISHPWAAEALSRFAQDRDPRVRQIAADAEGASAIVETPPLAETSQTVETPAPDVAALPTDSEVAARPSVPPETTEVSEEPLPAAPPLVRGASR